MRIVMSKLRLLAGQHGWTDDEQPSTRGRRFPSRGRGLPPETVNRCTNSAGPVGAGKGLRKPRGVSAARLGPLVEATQSIKAARTARIALTPSPAFSRLVLQLRNRYGKLLN